MMDTATAARAVDGQLIGDNVRVPARRRPTAARSRPAISSSRCTASASTATISSPRRSRKARRRRWSRTTARRRCAGDLIAVADPLAALGRLAAFWRARSTLPLVVVVGSNGKTTVKEMLAAILRAHFGDDARARHRRAISTTPSACR